MSKHNFVVGDKVRCVDTGPFNLSKTKVYTINGVNGVYVTLETKATSAMFRGERFELVEHESKWDFKVGDFVRRIAKVPHPLWEFGTDPATVMEVRDPWVGIARKDGDFKPNDGRYHWHKSQFELVKPESTFSVGDIVRRVENTSDRDWEYGSKAVYVKAILPNYVGIECNQVGFSNMIYWPDDEFELLAKLGTHNGKEFEPAPTSLYDKVSMITKVPRADVKRVLIAAGYSGGNPPEPEHKACPNPKCGDTRLDTMVIAGGIHNGLLQIVCSSCLTRGPIGFDSGQAWYLWGNLPRRVDCK